MIGPVQIFVMNFLVYMFVVKFLVGLIVHLSSIPVFST